MSIPQRLKEERERLRMSQPQLGELVRAGKTTVINWEKGSSAPDAVQLAAFAESGADVLYILTGQRGKPVEAEATLAPRVRALVNNYEHTDEAGKRIIEATASAAAKSETKQRRAAR